MSLLTLLLIVLGPFLVVAPLALVTGVQCPEFLRPSPTRRQAQSRWAVAW